MPEENIIEYVIDSSFILAHLLPDERAREVDLIFDNHIQGKANFHASSILPFEVANGLKYAVVSRRIDQKSAEVLLADFLKLPINLHTVDFKKTMAIGLKKGCSVYDASYIYLAKQKKLPLLTLDRKLKEIAS